jgi:hypothetical protein
MEATSTVDQTVGKTGVVVEPEVQSFSSLLDTENKQSGGKMMVKEENIVGEQTLVPKFMESVIVHYPLTPHTWKYPAYLQSRKEDYELLTQYGEELLL